MARSAEEWLGLIRGLLGVVVAMQLIVIAFMIQAGLQEFIGSVESIPTSFVSILNGLQVSVVLTVLAALLLVVGFLIRIWGPGGERED